MIINNMTTKERILLHIIRELSVTQTLARTGYGEDRFQGRSGDREYVHFKHMDPSLIEPGMIVLCESSGRENVHDFTVAKVVEYINEPWPMNGLVVQELGTDRLCNITNESFEVIVGLSERQLYSDEQQDFYLKVQAAFAKGDEYQYRFGGVVFDGSSVNIRIREAFGGMDAPSEPFYAEMPWTKKTTIAAILKILRKAGYGTRSFRPEGWVAPEKKSKQSVTHIAMSEVGSPMSIDIITVEK